MARLRNDTAAPSESALRDILCDLDELTGSLLVLNHPLWDEQWAGDAQQHVKVASIYRDVGPQRSSELRRGVLLMCSLISRLQQVIAPSVQ